MCFLTLNSNPLHVLGNALVLGKRAGQKAPFEDEDDDEYEDEYAVAAYPHLAFAT